MGTLLTTSSFGSFKKVSEKLLFNSNGDDMQVYENKTWKKEVIANDRMGIKYIFYTKRGV